MSGLVPVLSALYAKHASVAEPYEALAHYYRDGYDAAKIALFMAVTVRCHEERVN